jgi:hypothetical protein
MLPAYLSRATGNPLVWNQQDQWQRHRRGPAQHHQYEIARESFASKKGGFIMRRYSLHSSLIGGFAAACGLLASAGVALAAPETWVSGTGSNTGDCPITAPCRTFQFAHDRTNNNGAINVLSSGNSARCSSPSLALTTEALALPPARPCMCGIALSVERATESFFWFFLEPANSMWRIQWLRTAT